MKVRIDPRLKILYLILLAVLTFVLDDYRHLLILLGLQVFLWFLGCLSLKELGRGLRRVLFIVFFLIISTTLVAPEEGAGAGRTILLFNGYLKLYLTGLLIGSVMSLRILILIVGSLLVRLSGSSQEFVEGLKGLRVPAAIAVTLDVILNLLSGEAGRKKGKKKKKLDLGLVLKGDFSFLTAAIADSLRRAEEHIEQGGYEGSAEQLRDIGIVSGLTVMAMMTKFFKVLPGFPISPGHKSLLIIPLYVLAHELTTSRWGATWVGAALGVVAYLFGEGQFGIVEILKYVSPGILIDLVMPLYKGWFKKPNLPALAVLGLFASLAKLSTILLIAWLARAPRVFYLYVGWMAMWHSIFGFFSGLVSFGLLKSVGKFKPERGENIEAGRERLREEEGPGEENPEKPHSLIIGEKTRTEGE